MDKETKNIIQQRVDELTKENQDLANSYSKIKLNIEQLENLNKRTQNSIIGNNKALQELSALLPEEEPAKDKKAEVPKDDEKKVPAKKVDKTTEKKDESK